jgi:hypothetical protein
MKRDTKPIANMTDIADVLEGILVTLASIDESLRTIAKRDIITISNDCGQVNKYVPFAIDPSLPVIDMSNKEDDYGFATKG